MAAMRGVLDTPETRKPSMGRALLQLSYRHAAASFMGRATPMRLRSVVGDGRYQMTAAHTRGKSIHTVRREWCSAAGFSTGLMKDRDEAPRDLLHFSNISTRLTVPSLPHMTFRSDLNALRALAVSLVVLFHFGVPGFDSGFIGVDVFFVISGYLMTRIIWTGLTLSSFSYLQFIAARAARIWPALVCLILTLFLVLALLLPPLDYLDYAKQAQAASLFYSNHFFGRGTGYFTNSVDERWLLHTWSLSVEWQFYMLYPVYLWALHWTCRRLGLLQRWTPGQVLLAGIAALVLVSLALSVYITPRKPTPAFYLLPFRAWEMAAGGVLFALEPVLRGHLRGMRPWLYVAAACILIGTLVAGSYGHWESKWPGALAIWPVLAALLFLAGHNDASVDEPKWLKASALQSVGLWSYSIYLWHWPLVIALNFLDLPEQYTWPAKLAAIALSVILGSASFRLVEQRFGLRSKTWKAVLQPAAIGAFVGIAVAASVSVLAVRANGWEGRIQADKEFFELHTSVLKAKYILEECRNYKTQRIRTCTLNAGVPGPKTLVIGDSHAQHLYPWFEEHATTPVEFVTASGCQLFRGYNKREPGLHCDKLAALALETALDPAYSTVVVANNYGYNLGRMAEMYCRVQRGVCVDEESSDAELVDTNVQALQSIINAGKQLVVVEQMPIAPYNVPKKAMRHRFLGTEMPATYEQARLPEPGAQSYAMQVYSKLDGQGRLALIDLREELCEGTTCLIYDDDVAGPVLTDHSHLNPDWIVRNGQAFRAFVR